METVKKLMEEHKLKFLEQMNDEMDKLIKKSIDDMSEIEKKNGNLKSETVFARMMIQRQRMVEYLQGSHILLTDIFIELVKDHIKRVKNG